MGIVLIFGETAQIAVEIGSDRLIRSQVGIPRAVFGCPVQSVDGDNCIAEVVGGTIALCIVEAVLIRELEIDLTEDGLAIGDAGTVVPTLRGGDAIAAGIDRRVGGQLIVLQEAVVDRLAGTFVPVAIELEGDVTACVAELTIELQHTSYVFRVAVADIVLGAVVLHKT